MVLSVSPTHTLPRFTHYPYMLTHMIYYVVQSINAFRTKCLDEIPAPALRDSHLISVGLQDIAHSKAHI